MNVLILNPARKTFTLSLHFLWIKNGLI